MNYKKCFIITLKILQNHNVVKLSNLETLSMSILISICLAYWVHNLSSPSFNATKFNNTLVKFFSLLVFVNVKL
jgi:hypothetical protein